MDAVRMVVDYLVAEGFDAYPQVPDERPTDEGDPFVVVELTGGSSPNRFGRNPTVDCDCWATSRSGAAQLASGVADACLAMPERVGNVFHAELSTIYNNPDPDSGTPRYTVGVDIVAAV